jgi:hypothetical protein
MSWATCYTGSNNIHFDKPPKMSDGRNYSTWEPDATINDNIKKNANIVSNWDYRRYLQGNAKEIMKQNGLESCYALGISVKPMTSSTGTASVGPILFDNSADTSHIPNGSSDLKNMYMSREELNARTIAPSINTNRF